MKKKLASLFSGCGGMDLGFEGGFSVHKTWLTHQELKKYKKYDKNGFTKLDELGFETIFACDVNIKAKLSWDHFFSQRRDIDNVFNLKSIVDILKGIKSGHLKIPSNIDVVTGGFPCNDFSVAGRRLGFKSDKSHQGNKKLVHENDDPTVENRGMLYFWMREFIALTRPKVFYAENVKGLVSLGDAKEIIAHDFSSINKGGYHVLPVRVLKAIHYGIPQTRERVIFIGININKLKSSIRNHIKKYGQLPEEFDLYPPSSHDFQDNRLYSVRPIAVCKDALAGLPEPQLSRDPSHQTYSRAKYLKKGQGCSEINLMRPGPTIRAEHHGNIEFRRLNHRNGGKNIKEIEAGLKQRRLSVRECARIQTFPDEYDFIVPQKLSATDGYRLIGNAVPPLLAYRLGQKLDEVWDDLFLK
jgi:DNA (cytosine-5)-methyltransferase 1